MIKEGGVPMAILIYLFGIFTGMLFMSFCIIAGEEDKKLEEQNMKAGEKDGKEQQADKSIQSNVQADSEHHT